MSKKKKKCKKCPKSAIIEVTVPLWEQGVVLSIHKTVDKAIGALQKHFKCEFTGLAPGYTNAGGVSFWLAEEGASCVAMKHQPGEGFAIGVLLHELTHSTFQILKAVGAKKHNQETFCYTLQKIFESFDEKLMKKNYY